MQNVWSEIVSNALNRALKKLKMDSNSRYSPGHIKKSDKKDIATINYKTYTADS